MIEIGSCDELCDVLCFFFQAEDGIRELVRSRGLGDVYKRQAWGSRAYGVACTGASNCLPNFTFADVNGDGKADFIYQRTDVDEFRVLLSTGTGFGTDTAWGSKSYGVALSLIHI